MNFTIETLNKKGIKAPEAASSFWKKFLSALSITIVFFVFIIRIIDLQVIKHDSFKAKAENNFTKQIEVLPERGIIYSSSEKPLVQNAPYFTLVIDLQKMNKFITYESINEILSEEEIKFLNDNHFFLDKSFIKEFNQALVFGKNNYVIKGFYKKEDYIILKSKLSRIENAEKLKIVSTSYRSYMDSEVHSHILGYVSDVDAQDLNNDDWYTPSAEIGKTGLEKIYEKELRGKKGIQELTYDSKSSIEFVKNVKDPVNGNSLYTTINEELQQASFNELKKAIEEYEAVGGAVVVQNPQTGAVLSMVSFPSYDNNKFSKGIDTSTYNSYLEDEAKPLYNRAISFAFPPASTFKMVMAAAGLQEGNIKEDTLFDDPGVITVGNFTYKTWKSGGHGVINIVNAIKESSDTFFYVLGGGHENYDIEPLGVWNIYEWAKAFGFGERLGVDLPSESEGTVPNPNWKETTIDEPWYVGNTYHFSIGQGYLTATPLQVNNMTNIVATGGEVHSPYLVEKVVSSDGEVIMERDREESSVLPINKDYISIIKEGLVEASQPGGTAYPFFDYPVTIAGKTGTAEYGVPDEDGNLPTHAWFTAFVPADNPEVSITVFVENGGGGSDVAAPVAKEVLDVYFGFKEDADDSGSSD